MRLTSADYMETLEGYAREERVLEETLALAHATGRKSTEHLIARMLARTRQDIALRRPWIEALLAQAKAYEAQNGADHAHD